MSIFEDIGIGLGSFILGKRKLNSILINRLVGATRTRPHPWSTRYPFVGWAGLTDRKYYARLLPDYDWPGAESPSEPDMVSVASTFVAGPEGQVECPKSTCLFPAFAQYLTDGFLRTQLSNNDAGEDRKRTTTNHEIDQSPLYGRTDEQTRALRLLSNAAGEKGRLKSQEIDGEEWSPFLYGADGALNPDFVDEGGRPILDMPLGIDQPWVRKETLFAVGGDRVNAAPQTAMMNTLFLREHNRLAAMIEADRPDWDDERVFETARSISIVMFIKIVVEEYINHINTSKFRLRADPRVAWKTDWNRTNFMTIEFSLLYRWHSLVPKTVRWGDQEYDGGQLLMNNDVLLKGGLAAAFADVSANNAAQLGLANGVDFLMKAEQDSLGQSRINKLQGYIAYKAQFTKKKKIPKDWDDLVGSSKNPAEQSRRKRVASELRDLYGTVDKLEFYPGLFAEPRSKNGPLPSLVTAMVAVDAFSQALTNPLFSRHVWGDRDNRRETFTERGLAEFKRTGTLRDILERNSSGIGDRFVGMTRRDWKRE